MKFVSTLVATAFALALAGCNTMAGIGKDVQKAGSAVENAAKK